LFRNHSCINTRDQEPWAFDKETLDINRKYIKLRYRLLPYLYDLMWNSENSGLAVMRPLVFHYPNDENTYNINDEFMFGENILVAPILEQGKTYRAVYLPEGNWVDFWTGEIFTWKNLILKDAPLDVCPIYIKAGSIIPNYPEQRYIGEKNIEELILDVYPGRGEYIHYSDDGESFEYKNGKYNLYEFKMQDENELTVDINLLHTGYLKKYKTFMVIINGIEAKEIKFNGADIKASIVNGNTEFIIPAEEGRITIKN
jgi:alpha-glucosidase